jgi:hypothetical protein
MFLDLILFGSKLAIMAGLPYRDVNLKDSKSNTTYIRALHQQLTSHNAFKPIKTLKQGSTNQAVAEALDVDITRATLQAGAKCKRKQHTPWSPKLKDTRGIVNILKRAIGAIRLRLLGPDSQTPSKTPHPNCSPHKPQRPEEGPHQSPERNTHHHSRRYQTS